MNIEKPVFIQIIEMIENEIIRSRYKVDDIIISTTEISKLLSVNPTTAVKAVSILTDQGILYKKRGIGMCVADGAKEKIIARRKEQFFGETIPLMLNEADTLGISEEELIKILKEHKHD